MFRDIYKTTPCAGYNMDPIYLGVHEAAITGALKFPTMMPYRQVREVRILTSEDKTTPVFAHPITLKMLGIDEEVTVVDARSMTRIDRETNQVIVSAITEYEFAVLRASLQDVWVNGAPSDLAVLGEIVPKVFMRWVSQAMQKRLYLSPLEQLQISIIAGLFYFSMFGDAHHVEQDKDKIAARVARVGNIPIADVLAIADQITTMQTIHDFVSAVKTAIPSSRMDSLSVAFLYGSLSSGWFGANSREILPIALEHPPTFVALVYTALTNRTYYKSEFAQLVINCDKQGAGKVFVHGVNHLLGKASHV